MIIGVIIYFCRHSTTIVKLVGSSAVSVLATLFLRKLQRTVIAVFTFTYLQNYYGDGRSLPVRLFNGNVPFGKYNICLCSWWPLLSHSSSSFHSLYYCCLRPAYKHRIRISSDFRQIYNACGSQYLLLVGYRLNVLSDPDINNLMTVTVMSVLLGCNCVYKKKKLWVS